MTFFIIGIILFYIICALKWKYDKTIDTCEKSDIVFLCAILSMSIIVYWIISILILFVDLFTHITFKS